MMNISPLEMMKRISSLEKNMGSISKYAEGLLVTGESGAGMVKASVNADGMIKELEISDEAYALGDKNALSVLIISAINNAQEKKKVELQSLVVKTLQDGAN